MKLCESVIISERIIKLKTSLEAKRLEIDFLVKKLQMFIDTIFFFTQQKCVNKCVMCDLAHPVRYCNSSGSGKAFTPYCAAGPNPLVITGVTMESATVIRQ